MSEVYKELMRRAAARTLVEDYERLPAIEGKVVCGFCMAGRDKSKDDDMLIAVGFGSAGVMLNGRGLIEEQEAESLGFDIMLSDVEHVAKQFPPQDWRVYFYGPLSEQHYQRHGVGEWALVSRGDGFA